MINLLLALVSVFLFLLLEPISFVYVIFIKEKFQFGRLSGYWRDFAVAVDRFGNYQYRSLLNKFLVSENAYYQFGDFRETISSVLGKNERDKTLSRLGRLLVKILDKLDKDHCRKSINNFYD